MAASTFKMACGACIMFLLDSAATDCPPVSEESNWSERIETRVRVGKGKKDI